MVDHKAPVQFGQRRDKHRPDGEAGKVDGHGETDGGGTRDMKLFGERGSSRCEHCRGEVATLIVSLRGNLLRQRRVKLRELGWLTQ